MYSIIEKFKNKTFFPPLWPQAAEMHVNQTDRNFWKCKIRNNWKELSVFC